MGGQLTFKCTSEASSFMANLKILLTSGSLVASGTACTGALTGVEIASLVWELVSLDAINYLSYEL
jgi:hypothetical protein